MNTNGNNINGDHGSGGGADEHGCAESQYEVPRTSYSGTSASHTNPYNGSNQYTMPRSITRRCSSTPPTG